MATAAVPVLDPVPATAVVSAAVPAPAALSAAAAPLSPAAAVSVAAAVPAATIPAMRCHWPGGSCARRHWSSMSMMFPRLQRLASASTSGPSAGAAPCYSGASGD